MKKNIISNMVHDTMQIGEHETKYVLHNNRADKLRLWLAKKCLPDPEYHEGKVSSIYFDTKDFRMLSEKLSSDYLKTKVRLRWYSSIDSGEPFPATFLEIKKKIGSARVKIRDRLDIDSEWVLSRPLHNHEYLVINRKVAEQGVIFNGTLYPAFQINYCRSRFVEPLTGARLAVDSNIHVTRINRQMVNRENFAPLPDAVFELKNQSGILPDWLHQVNALGCRKGSFSKFSTCYAQLQRIIF